jgi:glycolate oxidase
MPGPAQDGLPVAASPAAALIPAMTRICGAAGVVHEPSQLATYECDGLTSHRTAPALVVLPETAEQVAAVVRACAGAGVPFVARGSGTGLSGGALPRSDGVLIVTSRMRRVLDIDPERK